ncbi:MAG: hypothetical protein HDS66_09350 [Bacteroidales bacterium]|nr:hypothetical protein [Bacteroidales bacterium]
MAKRVTKAEKIAKMSLESLGKLSGESGKKQLLSYARTLKSGYTRRVGSFKRKGLVSHAQISFEKSYPTGKQIPLNKMTRNQLLLEIARYSKFFNDQTSTEKGIRDINRQQDIRIFGANARGAPKMTMTSEEREAFWDFYEEFRNQYPEWSTQPFSESVQQNLADIMFKDPIFESMTFINRLEYAKKRFLDSIQTENIEDSPNVLLGRGANLKGAIHK